MGKFLPSTDGQAFLQALGSAVRRIRLDRGLSQERLAAAAGLDRTYIGGIERGERNVAAINILRISAALQIPASKLISEAEKHI